MLLDVCTARRRGCLETVLFGGQHLNQLSAAGYQGAQCLGGSIWQWPHHRTDRIGEVGEHLGVDRVGFGQLPDRLGEVADLAWINGNPR